MSGGALRRRAAAFAVHVARSIIRAAEPHTWDIERSWEDRCRAFREFEGDPEVLDVDATAQGYWNRIDAAETAILANPDDRPRAAEIRLWVAWWHFDHSNRTAVSLGDVAALRDAQPDLDWPEKLMFRAILDLRGER